MRNSDGTFGKGNPGKPKGTKNKATQKIREAIAKILEGKIEEVNDWSKFLTLKMIFEGLSNATDDIFHEKASRYAEMAFQASNRAQLRLDKDGDSVAEPAIDLMSGSLIRR